MFALNGLNFGLLQAFLAWLKPLSASRAWYSMREANGACAVTL